MGGDDWYFTQHFSSRKSQFELQIQPPSINAHEIPLVVESHQFGHQLICYEGTVYTHLEKFFESDW